MVVFTVLVGCVKQWEEVVIIKIFWVGVCKILFFITFSGNVCALPFLGMSESRLFPEQDSMAIIKAVESENEILLNSILEKKFNLNARGYKGVPILYWFVLSDNLYGFSKLLDLGGDPDHFFDSGSSLLHVLSLHQKVDFIEVAVSKGADVNIQAAGKGSTPLMESVLSLEKESRSFHALIALGANPYIEDSLGRTVFSQAVLFEKFHLVTLLIERGGGVLTMKSNQFLEYLISKKNINEISKKKRVEFIEMKKSLILNGIIKG